MVAVNPSSLRSNHVCSGITSGSAQPTAASFNHVWVNATHRCIVQPRPGQRNPPLRRSTTSGSTQPITASFNHVRVSATHHCITITSTTISIGARTALYNSTVVLLVDV